MGLFSKLFGAEPRVNPLDDARKIVDRFTTATIQGVDAEDIGRYPPKQRKVMAFHFGAIDYLAREQGLDETQTLALFVMFLDRYFNMPVTETGSISERLQGFLDNGDERRYLEAGVEVFRRWYEQDERRAPLQLGEMLQQS
ncbi:MAG: hypothetical protein OEN52_07235 [Gammaproteobacteria bacterium]|nr:hypothetical protein [Gammaproteobacteria bacterium]MDH3560730.1 hypothetical protein [Gammaproteobacteria bacterium]